MSEETETEQELRVMEVQKRVDMATQYISQVSEGAIVLAQVGERPNGSTAFQVSADNYEMVSDLLSEALMTFCMMQTEGDVPQAFVRATQKITTQANEIRDYTFTDVEKHNATTH